MRNRPVAETLKTVYILRAKGENRINYRHEDSISEVFDRESAPKKGSLCVIVSNEDEEFAGAETVLALALTRNVMGFASGVVRATLAPVLRMDRPLTLMELQRRGIQLPSVPNYFYAQKLDKALISSLIQVLSDHDLKTKPWLNAVFGSKRTYSGGIQRSRDEARDAIQLASQIAKIPLPADAFYASASGVANETLLETVLNEGYRKDMEEELLPLDIQRFDGKLIPDQRGASLAVFEDRLGEKKLLVMSVNKKPIEEELGVDLLYWDQIHDAFTFVQYKRLERISSSNGDGLEWAYLRRREIEKQLKLMPNGHESPQNAVDWRAFGSPFWIKFVRGDAAANLDNKTLKGMYVPVDWMRLAMSDSTFDTGPRGGFRVTYENTKYIGRRAFTELISRGFTGTAGLRSQGFKKVIETLGEDREVILAIKAQWEGNSEAKLV